MNRINERGYLVRVKKGAGASTRSQGFTRDWWFATESTTIKIQSLPSRYYGKKIRVKVEEVEKT